MTLQPALVPPSARRNSSSDIRDIRAHLWPSPKGALSCVPLFFMKDSLRYNRGKSFIKSQRLFESLRLTGRWLLFVREGE
jgi:hypothetical protein